MARNIILDSHKLAWHKERVDSYLAGERVAPITIDCALTRRCTFRCKYCYGQLQANDEKNLTQKVIFDFLDDAAEIGVKAISLVSDGESTCSRHLYDAIIHGRKLGLDMALGTNGYLLKQDRMGEILPALTYLRFNISAAEPLRYALIHGVRPEVYPRVLNNIREAVRVKRQLGLEVTLGLQMVLLPEYSDQILPMAELGRELEVDYLVIKHCSDDESGTLGVDYGKYFQLSEQLNEAEARSTGIYLVKAKWSKIMSGGHRIYERCYGPPLILQLSGSGLVAPCGMLFNAKYSKYHIGNIAEKRFKDIWKSERYWEVLGLLGSDRFNAKTMCGSLCLQHKVNECLWSIRHNGGQLAVGLGERPMHVNFI